MLLMESLIPKMTENGKVNILLLLLALVYKKPSTLMLDNKSFTKQTPILP